MKARHCPRCGKLVPSWQPIHFACLFERAKYWLLAGAFFIVGGCIILVLNTVITGESTTLDPVVLNNPIATTGFSPSDAFNAYSTTTTPTLMNTLVKKTLATSTLSIITADSTPTVSVLINSQPTNKPSLTPIVIPATSTSEPTQPVLIYPQKPDEFIRFYYEAINNRQYELTWSLLSEAFKENVNGPQQGGYQGYVDWWNTVEKVEVTQITIIKSDLNSATLQVKADYYYKNGATTHSNRNFYVIYDKTSQSWLFDW